MLSLNELEAIAQRLDAAAKVFRDARALLGGAAAVVNQPATSSMGAVAPPAILTPHEMAQREMLLARNRMEALPEEIQRAERTQPR